MSIELDITKLPAETIRRITRTARGFLKKFPNIHTIIIDRGEGVKTASEYKDFHLFLFMGEESDYDIRNRSLNMPDIKYNDCKIRTEAINTFHPGNPYEQVDRPLSLKGEKMKRIHNYKIKGKHHEQYLNFLNRNLFHYEVADKNQGFAPVTTINSPVMRRDNPAFCKTFLTKQFEKGYLLFHNDLKPEVFIYCSWTTSSKDGNQLL